MDGLNIAAGALHAAQTGLDVTANNLANVNTTGFRSSSVEYQTGPGGRGVEVGAIAETTFPGPVSLTGGSLNLALQGDGYFAVRTGSGRLAFTRDGAFQIDAQGRMVTPGGDLLDPAITVPSDAQSLSIGRDGAVRSTGADGAVRDIGRIQPVRFSNSQGLSPIGGNLQVPTPASGPGQRVEQGIVSGALEMSNTDLATQMVNLIRDENFSAVNVVSARTQDEVLGTILDLKR